MIENIKMIEIEETRAQIACMLNELWHSRLPKIHWSNVVRNTYYVCYVFKYKQAVVGAGIWSSPVARKINRELSRKAKNVSQIREVARQPEMMAKKNMKNLNQQINDSESLIQGYSKEAEDLGLELRMVDNETGRIRHFGKRYPNITTLKNLLMI